MFRYNGLKKGLLLFICIFFMCCSSDDEPIIDNTPKSLNLSHSFLYEGLPTGTIVAQLSTDTDIANPKYRLVAGDGDTDNGDFIISSVYLQTRRQFSFAEEPVKQIRLRVNNGTDFLEVPVDIEVRNYTNAFPVIGSNSFVDDTAMPREFGADNGNVSPDLYFENPNEDAASVTILMTDLDDGGSIHWAVWNISPQTSSIKQNHSWANEVTIGDNDFGTGYTGPFPPSEHRYKISVYYLSSSLNLDSSDFRMLEFNMIGKLMAQASIIGTYAP